MNIIDALDRLANLRDEATALTLRRNEAEAVVLGTIQPQLDAIAMEFMPLEATIGEALATVEAEVKAAVIEQGATVKGARLQAVYTKGRESVDMKAFGGYCLSHPEAKALIQTGAPSVSIRVNGKA